MKIDGKEVGYISILSKNALAYNLAYHLRHMKEEDNPYLIIEKVLNTFSFKKENS
jgi:hypothetical protein